MIDNVNEDFGKALVEVPFNARDTLFWWNIKLQTVKKCRIVHLFIH